MIARRPLKRVKTLIDQRAPRLRDVLNPGGFKPIFDYGRKGSRRHDFVSRRPEPLLNSRAVLKKRRLLVSANRLRQKSIGFQRLTVETQNRSISRNPVRSKLKNAVGSVMISLQKQSSSFFHKNDRKHVVLIFEALSR